MMEESYIHALLHAVLATNYFTSLGENLGELPWFYESDESFVNNSTWWIAAHGASTFLFSELGRTLVLTKGHERMLEGPICHSLQCSNQIFSLDWLMKDWLSL